MYAKPHADWRIYKCEHCGDEFRRTARGGRKPKFCTDQCRDRARGDRDWRVSWENLGWTTADPRNARKSSTSSTASTGVFRGRGIDLAGLEPELRRLILSAELPRLRREPVP
jgi:hypothetical protein